MRKQPNSHHCFICGVSNSAGVHEAFYDTVDGDGAHWTEARFRGREEH